MNESDAIWNDFLMEMHIAPAVTLVAQYFDRVPFRGAAPCFALVWASAETGRIRVAAADDCGLMAAQLVEIIDGSRSGLVDHA